MKFLVFLLVLSVSCFAQEAPKAVIEGPTETPPGQLTILSAEKSVGVEFLWIPGKGLGSTLAVEGNRKLVLATPNVGPHQVMLVVSNETGKMNYVLWDLYVGKKPTTPPDVPPPPDTPPPPPPPPDKPPTTPVLDKLKDVSRIAAKSLEDPKTAVALAAAIKSSAKIAGDKAPEAAQSAMVQAIETVFLQRIGSSRDKPWISAWRQVINQALKEAKLTTTDQYVQAMLACAEGLEASTK